MDDHKITSKDNYEGTVARCICGWEQSWRVQDGSAERDGADHVKLEALLSASRAIGKNKV
jgi:hypothetical protein